MAGAHKFNKETITLSAEHPEVPMPLCGLGDIHWLNLLCMHAAWGLPKQFEPLQAESTGVPPPESFWPEAELVENTKGHQQPAMDAINSFRKIMKHLAGDTMEYNTFEIIHHVILHRLISLNCGLNELPDPHRIRCEVSPVEIKLSNIKRYQDKSKAFRLEKVRHQV